MSRKTDDKKKRRNAEKRGGLRGKPSTKPAVVVVAEPVVATRGVSASYFHGRAFSSELLRGFFAAAKAFRDAAPWRLIDAEESIDLDIPALGVAGTLVSVNNSEGLAIFASRDNIDVAAMARGTLEVKFHKRGLPWRMQEELQQLPFAPTTGAIPGLWAEDNEALSRALGREDCLIATATLVAVTRLIEDHRQILERGIEPMEGTYEVEVDGDTYAVRLGMAWDSPKGVGFEGEGPRPSEASVHRLKVKLRGSKPAAWRRVAVPSTFSLRDLHAILMVLLGWTGAHTHVFVHDGHEIGRPDAWVGYDEWATELWAVLPAVGSVLVHRNYFGPGWAFEIEVEAIGEVEGEARVPRCLDGQNGGPPEEGEFEGFVADSKDVVYEPSVFSIEAVNTRLDEVYRI